MKPNAPTQNTAPVRRGAIGKALLVWLVSGSFGLALIAFLVFAGAGC
jgi:hypothetical protein